MILAAVVCSSDPKRDMLLSFHFLSTIFKVFKEKERGKSKKKKKKKKVFTCCHRFGGKGCLKSQFGVISRFNLFMLFLSPITKIIKVWLFGLPEMFTFIQ